jgi:hypothetical protein
MKLVVSSCVLTMVLMGGVAPVVADGRTEKYRSGGCEVERKYGSDKYESKVECKPVRGVARRSAGEGKEEFRRNGCDVKREWKQNGEYKEEVKCD